MKFISKKILSIILITSLLCSILVGCKKESVLDKPYSEYNISVSENNTVKPNSSHESDHFFATDLCVSESTDYNQDAIQVAYIGGGGIFDITNKNVLYGNQLFEKKYPASTTKILTGYLTIKYCNLEDEVTISETAVDMPSGAVTCGIQVGDVLKVKDLLYALMIQSANDAAIALAEHISGSVEAFSLLMNEEARNMGATHTNFVNPNGLHDDNHYTTIYDMYLIFNEAIKSELFCEIINTKTYTATYQSVRGSQVKKTYSTTNQFFNSNREYPDNFTIVGGKTGTTHDAGKCLVLYVKSDNGTEYILIGFGCDTKDILYNYIAKQMEYINEVNP